MHNDVGKNDFFEKLKNDYHYTELYSFHDPEWKRKGCYDMHFVVPCNNGIFTFWLSNIKRMKMKKILDEICYQEETFDDPKPKTNENEIPEIPGIYGF